MKFLAVFSLILVLGLASASQSLHKALDKSVDDVVTAFEEGMRSAPALSEAVSEDSKEANEVDSDTKSELAKALRESLEDTINKIKTNIDEKHQSAKDLIEKANQLVDQLKQLRVRVGDKAKDLISGYKEKVSDLFAKLIEKIQGGDRTKRSVSEDEEVILQGLNLSSLLENVKAKLRDHISTEKITEYVNSLFGKFNPLAEEFVKTIQTRGQEALLRVVDNLLRILKPRETRAIKDVLQNVREFLHGLGDHVRGQYADFADWLSTVWSQGIAQAKGKHEKLMEIAREVVSHAKDMHKETVREAVEALRPFREELGSLWTDLLNSARDALKKKD